jgi:high-affinity nickel-transport protein
MMQTKPKGLERRSGRWSFSGSEWARLGGFGGAILALHAVGWGLVVLYAGRYPQLVGLAALAYSFGLRHAFDADHIAAIDNTTRKFLAQGKRALGIGFFFSLGHSTVVFLASAALAVGAKAVGSHIPAIHHYGSLVGASVSAGFLYLIGILNLIVLVDVVRIYRRMKKGAYSEETLEETLNNRGFMNRFLGRAFRLIGKSWHMYPLGFLFGLGFDTASEIALLAITATAASKLPMLAIISLPILFAAGMSLMDTADGVFMTQAYQWAFSNPLRKVYYNITVTSLSVAVALLVGTVELIQVVANQLNMSGAVVDFFDTLNFQTLGFVIVGMFVAAWA